jgi:type IV secretion system protein VirB9
MALSRFLFRFRPRCLAALLAATAQPALAGAATIAPDPRMKEMVYDGKSVITILVARGIATAIELDPTDAITFAATGVGADCARESDSWCIAALPGARVIFVKPKSFASGSNNLQIVSTARSYAFRFDILARADPREPVYRLSIKAAPPQPAKGPPVQGVDDPGIALRAASAALASSPHDLVNARLTGAPQVVNTRYSVALGNASDDIVPSLVFDDGRFTYLRFAANREIPAVFQIGQDGVESMVNVRMEGDLLVVDRIARRVNLRMGRQIVAVFNDAFDPDGLAPVGSTTVSGVERVTRREVTRELQP